MKFFDLHCDTPYECYVKGLDIRDASLAASTVYSKPFEIRKQCFAVWIKDDMTAPFEFYKNAIGCFKQQLNKYCPDNLVPFFTVEGGALLEGDTERLETLSADGIRALTLTWNGKNEIASGALETGGLTDFGQGVIEKMNRLKIACDLSHLNRESFFYAIDIAEYPFASHSALCEINEHPRNLDREQVKELCRHGGIIGLCFYPVFLGGGDVFEKFYRCVCELLDAGYENNIAVGSDFDGAKQDERLCNVEKIPVLYAFLEQKGIKKTVLDKIFYKNADNFFLKL